MRNRMAAPVQSLWQGESLVIMARIRSIALDAPLITQASLTSITCAVYDGDTLIDSSTLVKGDVISDTLVTNDSRWTEDSTGYNFVATLDGSTCFPLPGKRYEVEITLTSTTGHLTDLVAIVQTGNLRSR